MNWMKERKRTGVELLNCIEALLAIHDFKSSVCESRGLLCYAMQVHNRQWIPPHD